MRSGHRKARSVPVACALAVSLWASTVLASPRVTCVTPGDPELARRIEGQTRDLAVALEFVPANLPNPPQRAQLRSIARQRAAELVVAVQPQAGGGETVYVYDRARDVLRARPVPPPRPGERLARSTVDETAAIIVRGEVRALLASPAPARGAQRPPPEATSPATGVGGTPDSQHGQSGRDRAATTPSGPAQGSGSGGDRGSTRTDERATGTADTGDRSPARDAGPPPAAATAAGGSGEWTPPRPSAHALRPRRTPRLSVAAGVNGRLPLSRLALVGPALTLRLDLPHVALAVAAETTLERTLRDSAVAVTLREHRIVLEVLATWLIAHDVQLSVGAAGGASLIDRQTARASGFEATDARQSVSAAVGPLAELRLWAAARVGFAARLGVDFLPAPTRFRYPGAGGTQAPAELASLASYQPWASLAVFADIWE